MSTDALMIRPNELIYDDRQALVLAKKGSRAYGRGWEPRNFNEDAFGSVAEPLTDQYLLPESKWKETLEQQIHNGARVSDVILRSGIAPLDQRKTNYCWINGPTNCARVAQLIAGNKFIDLSPASVGAPIQGYRNVGGWCTQGLKYIIETGICPLPYWPANAIDKQYDTAESRAARIKVTEWWDVQCNDKYAFNRIVSLALQGIPSAVGYNWWGHAVIFCDLVLLDNGQWGGRIWNSWGMWGDRGFAVYPRSKMVPNDACAVRVFSAA